MQKVDAQEIIRYIDTHSGRFIEAMDRIWQTPELYFREMESTRTLASLFEGSGFTVTWGAGGIRNAFTAHYGSEGPTIGYLGEMDALPGLSQQSGVTEHRPLVAGGPGHGCGHNAQGVASAAAALAAAAVLREHQLPGQILFVATPAEEAGCGKAFLVAGGVFDGVDAVITWHPGTVNSILGVGLHAMRAVFFHFKGIASHAAASPELGRSALDACELMNVGVNYLREHIPSEARLHYAYQEWGGLAPNIVQETSTLKYYIRAPKVSQVLEISERVFDIARGAALMTGTQVEIEIQEGLCDFIPNDVISRVMSDAYLETGGPHFTDEDRAFAKRMFDTYPEAQRRNGLREIAYAIGPEAAEAYLNTPLLDEVFPYRKGSVSRPGASDTGDVSYIVPTGWLYAATFTNATSNHTWQATAQSSTGLCHAGMLAAARGMGLAAIRLLENPDQLAAAKAELEKTTGGQYQPLLGPNAKAMA